MGTEQIVVKRVARYRAISIDEYSIHNLSRMLGARRYEFSSSTNSVTFFHVGGVELTANIGDFVIFNGREFAEVCTYTAYISKYEEVK
jgi:hypothetical protein